MSVAVTVAGAPSVYATVSVSPGRTVVGEAATFCNVSAAIAPTVPVAERAFCVAIVQVYLSGGAALASQVQSTFVPVPLPCATCAPAELTTVTVHACATERRAVDRKSVVEGRRGEHGRHQT